MTTLARHPSPLRSVVDARAELLAGLRPAGGELVDLDDALGRVLRDDVRAASDLPGTDNSAMDGYAVVAADLLTASAAAPVVLPVGGESRAGCAAPPHRDATATVIATGAPMPDGADAVVPIELTVPGEGTVRFTAPVTPGNHVRRRGEDARAGDVLLRAGTRLRSVDVGVAAAAGVATITAGRRPVVAIVSGGDELVAPGTPPLPHQVTDVNGVMLAAAVAEAGGIPLRTGIVADDPDSVRQVLSEAGAHADLIVSSAGVSVGGHDHVRECVAALGSVDLWRVAMRPGKPLVIGRVGRTPFVGLPGNPVSGAVTFLLFARPAILALQGATELLPPPRPVRLAEAFSKPAGLEMYVRVRLEADGGVVMARSSGGQGSAMMHALAAADALAVLPAGTAEIAAGTTVTALELP